MTEALLSVTVSVMLNVYRLLKVACFVSVKPSSLGDLVLCY